MALKNTVALTLSLVTLLSCSGCNRHPMSLSQQHVQQGMREILAQFPEPAAIGIKIQSMKTGEVLFQQNANQAFTPASNLKLFTAVAALIYLGPTYQYQTTLATQNNKIQNGVVAGDVYLKFSGDPDFTAADLDDMFYQLSKQGVHQIKGNLYLDTNTYDSKMYGPGWMWDDLNYCYASPISAIMINHNCLGYTMTPASTVGEMALLQRVDKQPLDAKFISVQSAITTTPTKTNCKTDINIIDDGKIALAGCIPQNSKTQDLQIAIKDPAWYVKNLLPELLAKNQIVLQGNIAVKPAVDPAAIDNNKLVVLVTHASKPLRMLVDELLKTSDNLIANTLLKTLGAVYYQQQGTWQNGVKAMQAILAQNANVDFTKTMVVDGAGLSTYDLVTPNQVSQLLNYAYHDFAISPELISSLPIAGSDGTLNKRLVNFDILVRAKTGSLTGVSSLSGYVETSDHEVLSFVILVNNHIGSNDSITQLEDKICQFLSRLQ